MNYEGIYRKSGGNGQTKLITQYFERGQDFDLLDVDKFNDLAAVTSCMKNFFRSLPDPLFTHDLHEAFVGCIGAQLSLYLVYVHLLNRLPLQRIWTTRSDCRLSKRRCTDFPRFIS